MLILLFVVAICGHLSVVRVYLRVFWGSGNFSHMPDFSALHPSVICTKSIVLFIQPWRPLCLLWHMRYRNRWLLLQFIKFDHWVQTVPDQIQLNQTMWSDLHRPYVSDRIHWNRCFWANPLKSDCTESRPFKLDYMQLCNEVYLSLTLSDQNCLNQTACD